MQTIDEGAFDHSGLEYIKIPDSVKTIESRAFTRCYYLKNISLGNSIRSIGSLAFSRCGLQDIVFPDSLVAIEAEAFSGSLLENITFTNSISSINSYAFYGCTELKNVVIPNSINNLSSDTFAYCSSDLKITIGINDINHFYSLTNFIAYNNQKNITLDIPYGTSLDIEDELLNGCNKAEIGLNLENGDIYNGGISNENVYLIIPAQHKKDNIVITKDGKPYATPDKTERGYGFYESGYYKIKVITDAYVESEIEIIIVDKLQLKKLIETIETSDKFVEDKWTSESWNTLLIALEKAKSVLNDSSATQDQVNSAANILQDAIDQLEVSADINKDGSVDIEDLALVSKYFGQEKLEYDLNGDNIINEFEINYISNKILNI
ncbi:leucine-rich repeat protein [Clostridium tarantellae]|uniref:Leucine-rich repeat protein n=1 Tax=Clostridium tarantellae TaxID=39493 RepID=A0A6I1MS37_9CLOT|nr:leucine-rich repeat protein [Clostridium tarantellae]